MSEMEYRVLSIQSHVVFGQVGNDSATFPLQVLGFDVDAINTVQFSNHSGYKFFKGQEISEQDLGELVEGLEANDLLNYTHVLTGYCRSTELLSLMGKLVTKLKQKNPSLTYVCDPVMGDHGEMYVPKDLLAMYKYGIIPLADVLCPNQFEAELLTDKKITDKASLMDAISTLHDRGIKTVVITSSDFGTPDHIMGVASTTVGGIKKTVSIEIPKLDATFVGTGDLFASLMLAWLTKTNHDVEKSLENTIATIQYVLEKTLTRAKELSTTATPSSKHLELRLIQSKNSIENPVVQLKAKSFTV